MLLLKELKRQFLGLLMFVLLDVLCKEGVKERELLTTEDAEDAERVD